MFRHRDQPGAKWHRSETCSTLFVQLMSKSSDGIRLPPLHPKTSLVSLCGLCRIMMVAVNEWSLWAAYAQSTPSYATCSHALLQVSTQAGGPLKDPFTRAQLEIRDYSE